MLFLQHGFDGTTVEMICAESQYSKPTLYAYFKSKDDIYAINLARRMRELSGALTAAISAHTDIISLYLACCNVVADFAAAFPVYFQGITGGVTFVSEESSEISNLSSEINGKFCSLIDRAVKSGTLRRDTDIPFAYAHIWSCVFGIITSAKLKQVSAAKTYREIMNKSFMTVLEGFRNED